MSGEKREIRFQIALFVPAVLAIYLLDRVTKYLAVTFLDSAESVPLVKHAFHLTLVFNSGAAFGIFKDHPYIFTGAGIIAILAIAAAIFVYNKKLGMSEKLAMIFILSGAAGNLTDRISCGGVIDFIDFRIWPVFNVADIFITSGAAVLLFSILFSRRKKGEV